MCCMRQSPFGMRLLEVVLFSAFDTHYHFQSIKRVETEDMFLMTKELPDEKKKRIRFGVVGFLAGRVRDESRRLERGTRTAGIGMRVPAAGVPTSMTGDTISRRLDSILA